MNISLRYFFSKFNIGKQHCDGRIKNKIITTATTMDKEVGITHREVGIVIGTMDMIIR